MTSRFSPRQDYNDDIRQEQLREMQMMNAGMTNCNASSSNSSSSVNDVENGATTRSHSAAGSANANGLSSLANPLNLSVVSVQLATKAANLPISSANLRCPIRPLRTDSANFLVKVQSKNERRPLNRLWPSRQHEKVALSLATIRPEGG
jgi:hypothetical protein